MKDKLKKKDNILICSIDEKDLKAIPLGKSFSPEIDVREKHTSKNLSANKINKYNEYTFNLNNTIFFSNSNRSFSSDLSRKQYNNNTHQTFIGTNNGFKTKEITNHSVIKLYSLSSLKSNTIDLMKNKKTRNTSDNQFSIRSDSKKYSSKLAIDPVSSSNNPQITSILKRLLNNNLKITKENNYSSKNHNKTKSKTSLTNTPISLNINSLGEHNFTLIASIY